MESPPSISGLTVDGCLSRQSRLRQRLEQLELDAALITDQRHVYYFTGFWARSLFAPAVLIKRDGDTILTAPLPPQTAMAATEVVVYESNQIGTLVDHQDVAAITAIKGHFSGLKRIGCDRPVRGCLLSEAEQVDIADVMLALRRSKDDDEVTLLCSAIDATEAAYRYAQQALEPGITEVELFAGMQQAAVAHVGETIGEFGNDFQIGAVGSPPRRRAAQKGEVAIFDVTVVVRGYCSDMCRSFVVGGEPSDQQLKAYQRIMQVLSDVEHAVGPGYRCKRLYEEACDALDGYEGWVFKHHLGHGIGLNPHEAPRLNPH